MSMPMGTRTISEKKEEIRKADASLKNMDDFTSPEVLYQELINSVKKYHQIGRASCRERV